LDKILKNIEIINAVKSISELLQLEDLPTRINWILSKNLRKLQSSDETYSKCEIELLNKYVLRDDENKIRQDENGNPKFAPKMKDEYMKRLNELVECEDTICVHVIKLSDLPEKLGKGVNLFNIDFMIDDSE